MKASGYEKREAAAGRAGAASLQIFSSRLRVERPEVVAAGAAVGVDLPHVVAGRARVGDGLVGGRALAARDDDPGRAVPLQQVEVEVRARGRADQAGPAIG